MAFRGFLWIPRIELRILTELRSEKFELFGPSPIEPGSTQVLAQRRAEDEAQARQRVLARLRESLRQAEAEAEETEDWKHCAAEASKVAKDTIELGSV